MLLPPPRSTLFPYTTLFRSLVGRVALLAEPADHPRPLLAPDVLARHRHVAGLDLARRRAHRIRSEEHTSELQSLTNLVCRLLLEKTNERLGLRTPINSPNDH